MPTDEERREVARRLRDYLKTYQSPTWRDLLWLVFGDSEKYNKYRLYMVLDRIADLIEPEPERTCSNVACSPCAFRCSKCGWFDKDRCDFNFCPNCGEKVVVK